MMMMMGIFGNFILAPIGLNTNNISLPRARDCVVWKFKILLDKVRMFSG